MKDRELPFEQHQKIAVVSHSHPDLTKGGAEVAAYALYRALRNIGRPTIFVASCLEEDVTRVEPRPGEYLLPRDPDPNYYDHFYHLAAGNSANQLRDLLTLLEVDVVNFHHFYNVGLNSITALRGLDIRVVLTLHEYLAICHHHGQMVTRPQKNLCHASSRIACQTCFPELHGEEFEIRKFKFLNAFDYIDHFISPSHFLKQRFSNWGIDQDRISVIENGLAGLEEKLASSEPRSANEQTERQLTIGYFGQITPFKGVGVILDVIEKVQAKINASENPINQPPYRFVVHGNLVGLEEAFVDRFRALEEKTSMLQFKGPYANSDVITLMHACDYVIVPSQWCENSPVVIQEAYAAECPVIASNLGGLAEKVIDGVSGLTFRVGDAESLMAVLGEASKPEVLEKLRASLPKVPGASEMASAYLEVFGCLSENTGV